jgi:molecular chaperone DnaK
MIIGIDLGTSTSEVAFVDKSAQVVVIPNKDGELITPSVVYIKHSGRAFVGSEAKEYLFTRPDSTFMEVKRIFGTEEKLIAHEKSYLPEEIQAFIIEYLVDCAEEYTGEKVTGAVITVPAYFTDVQRKQTIRAGALADIQVERVINEPTAAALDYGLKNMTECEHILVYDFGGGTLDVTVLELFEGVIDVKSSCGNNRLGGKDFDNELMKYIADHNYNALMADPKAAMKLKQAAIDAKITLSEVESVDVRLPLIAEDISIDKTITRAKFEEIIRSMVVSTGEQIDIALQDAGLEPSDLQKVILVGGTTRIPFVRKFVKGKIGVATNADNDHSPELMVVRGAAIQAAIIEGVIAEESSVVLTDVCPFTLGVKAVTNEGFKVDPLIRKNVTIPYEFNKVYSALYEYQRAILFEIYQGESKYPQENTLIGQLELDKLPRRQNERAKAEVTFSYDINGLLNVTARSLGNDKIAATVIDINNNDLPVRLPVKLSSWEQAKGASKYRPLLKKALKIIDMFIDTPFFVEAEMYTYLNYCDELKANLILGDEDGVALNAEKINEFLDDWVEKAESFRRLLEKYGNGQGI